MKKDFELMTRLLSGRPGLSVQEKEEILVRILARQQEGVRSGQTASRLVFKYRYAAVALVIALVPLAIFFAVQSRHQEFRSKGAGAKAPRFAVYCIDPDGKQTCRQGAKLAFRLRPPKGRPYFSAFGKHRKNNLVVWYFPAGDDDSSVSTYDVNPGETLQSGIEIGSEHAVGEYEIFGLFSGEPLHRDEIRHLFEEGGPSQSTEEHFERVIFRVEQPN